MMRSILANGVAMLAARLLVPAFSFVISIAIARLYGAEALGAYSHLLAALVILQAVASAGMPLLLTRNLSANPEGAQRLVADARSFGVASGTVAMVLFAAYAAFTLPPARYVPVAVLALGLVPSAWIAIQEALFMATRTHYRMTIVAFLENATKLALALVAFAFGGHLLALCAGLTVARLVALVAGQRLLRSTAEGASWRLHWRAVAPIAASVAPFAGLLIVSIAYFRIDILLLRALRGEEATGLYSAAAALFTAALMLPESAMGAIYPRLSAAFPRSRAAFTVGTVWTVRALTIGMVPLSLLLIGFAGPLLRATFGPRFAQSGPVLQLLAASIPIHALNGALGQALQAARQQRPMLAVVAIGLASQAALTVAAIRVAGIEGPAIAVLLSSSLVALGGLLLFHRRVSPIRVGLANAATCVAIAAPVALLQLPSVERRTGAVYMLAGLCLAAATGLLRERHSVLRALAALAPRRREASV